MIRASIWFGSSFGWTDPHNDPDTLFHSVSEVLTELRSPGKVTGNPRSFYPCAKEGWRPGEVVASLFTCHDNDTYECGDMFAQIVIGPRGGLHVQRV